MSGSSQEKTIYYLTSSFICVLYVMFVTSLPNDWFRDRDYYVIYANEAEAVIQSSKTIFALVLNEPIFLRLAQFYGEYLTAESFPIFMSGLVSSIYIVMLMKYSKTIIMFVLGVISLIFISYLQTAQLMVLRQGVATSIFLVTLLLVKSERKKLIVCILLSFFHSVFFIISIIYALYIYFLKNKSTVVMLTIVGAVSAVFYISSTFLLSYMGFRQAEIYVNETETSGGGAFVLSIFTFIYLYFWGNKENKELYDWTLIGLILFIVGYFLFFSAGRLFVSFFPFVLILLVTKSRFQDILFLLIINLIYIFLFYRGAYMILFEYTSQSYVTDIFDRHINQLLDFF